MDPVVAHVTGLPAGASMGDVEGIIMPRISGRIVAIGLRDGGQAVIEFARQADAGLCLTHPRARHDARKKTRPRIPRAAP